MSLCRNVPGPQVAHDGHAQPLGDPRRLADLHRAERVPVLDPVIGRLAVAGDGVDRAELVDDRAATAAKC